MEVMYCNAFNIDKVTLKTINDVLTIPSKETVEEIVKAPCGGFLLDGTVFKIDKRTGAVTKKGNLIVQKTIAPYCGGIKLDSAVFKIDKKGIVSLVKPLE